MTSRLLWTAAYIAFAVLLAVVANLLGPVYSRRDTHLPLVVVYFYLLHLYLCLLIAAWGLASLALPLRARVHGAILGTLAVAAAVVFCLPFA